MKKPIGHRVMYGALAGVTGAACMTPLRVSMRRLGVVEKMVPQAIEEALYQKLVAKVGPQGVSRPAHSVVDHLLHFGFGGTLGAVFGLVSRGRGSVLLRGLGFGTAAWLLGAGIVVPALGAARPLWQTRPREHLVNWLAHAIYGISTALVADELAGQPRHHAVPPALRQRLSTG